MKFTQIALLSLCALVSQLTCAEETPAIVPPKIIAQTPIDVSQKNISRTVDFTAWKVNVDPIDLIGTTHPGVFCSGSAAKHYWPHLGDWMRGQLRDIYMEKATKVGYPKHQAGDSAFEQKIGSDSDFKMGMTLVDIKFAYCGNDKELNGTNYLKLKWELFSVLRQKVVYSKTVESSFDNQNGPGLTSDEFYRKLIGANVDNLLADPEFVRTFESGDNGKDVKSDQPILTLKSSAPAKVDVSKSAIGLQSAVVTIESGIGTGSGFFISDDGYLLTNAHVVGGAKFVKLKSVDGHSMIGQVMRLDSIRDVALVKTESTELQILAIRKTSPVLGESVYALGSPYGEWLAGTMTQGVLSSRRTLEGVTYLQSDASLHPGNSGGPLIDASGSVIGIAQITVGTSGGINLFIPIDEALEKLALTVN